jgi:hypothetical protein
MIAINLRPLLVLVRWRLRLPARHRAAFALAAPAALVTPRRVGLTRIGLGRFGCARSSATVERGMRRKGFRSTVQAAAVLALVCLGLAMAEDAFLHTDDGCLIETHCVACRWHHGAVVVTPAVAQLHAAPAAIQIVAAAPTHVAADGPRRTASSRGPPLA